MFIDSDVSLGILLNGVVAITYYASFRGRCCRLVHMADLRSFFHKCALLVAVCDV